MDTGGCHSYAKLVVEHREKGVHLCNILPAQGWDRRPGGGRDLDRRGGDSGADGQEFPLGCPSRLAPMMDSFGPLVGGESPLAVPPGLCYWLPPPPPRAAPPFLPSPPDSAPGGCVLLSQPCLLRLRWIRGKKPSPERHSRFRPFCNLVARPSPALNPWPPPQPAMLLHGHHAFVWLPPLLEPSPPSLLDSPLRARPATPARPCPARFPFPIIVRPPPGCVLAWLGHP